MDSFLNWLKNYWGKVNLESAANSMQLHVATLQVFQDFVTHLVMDQLNTGQPVPTPDQIYAEWQKTHPPVQYVSTPFGSDAPHPVSAGGATLADLVSELKTLIQHYGG